MIWHWKSISKILKVCVCHKLSDSLYLPTLWTYLPIIATKCILVMVVPLEIQYFRSERNHFSSQNSIFKLDDLKAEVFSSSPIFFFNFSAFNKVFFYFGVQELVDMLLFVSSNLLLSINKLLRTKQKILLATFLPPYFSNDPAWETVSFLLGKIRLGWL